jgi:hypothetical protein
VRRWLHALATNAGLPLAVYARRIGTPRALATAIGQALADRGQALAAAYLRDYQASGQRPAPLTADATLAERIGWHLFQREKTALDAERDEAADRALTKLIAQKRQARRE